MKAKRVSPEPTDGKMKFAFEIRFAAELGPAEANIVIAHALGRLGVMRGFGPGFEYQLTVRESPRSSFDPPYRPNAAHIKDLYGDEA